LLTGGGEGGVSWCKSGTIDGEWEEQEEIEDLVDSEDGANT
jgi:hypothetical protein